MGLGAGGGGGAQYLGEGVPSVAGLLGGVLLVDDIAARGHGAEQQRLLHVVLRGGEQLPDHGHHLWVLDQDDVPVHAEGQVPLERSPASAPALPFDCFHTFPSFYSNAERLYTAHCTWPSTDDGGRV